MKNMIKRILFATDFSQSSSPALQTALTWTNTCDAILDVVHVMGILQEIDLESAVANMYIKEQRAYLNSELDQLASRAKESLREVHPHLLEGQPAHTIISFAQDSRTDLIITGTHGRTGIDHVMLGSVAERVICKAPCPVLSVRDVTADDEMFSKDFWKIRYPYTAPRHILLPIDFSDCALDAYEYADNLMKCFDVSITLIHALEPISYSLDFTLSHPSEVRQHQEKVKSRLADLTNVLSKQGLTANYVIKHKPASEAIIETLTEVGADLIIMGTHGRQGLRRLVMGNVAAAVLRQSPVPVLTVKSPKFKHNSKETQLQSLQETNG